MKVWLDYSRDLGYLEPDQVEGWQSEYSRISRMLHGLTEGWN